MTKSTILSVIRSAFTLLGAYAIGHNLFGRPIDAKIWEELSGTGLLLIGSIWGFFDKSVTIEGLESVVRSFMLLVGGLAVAAGKLSNNTLISILSFLPAIGVILQSYVGKVKVVQIGKGDLVADSTTGQVKKAGPKIS